MLYSFVGLVIGVTVSTVILNRNGSAAVAIIASMVIAGLAALILVSLGVKG